VVDLDAGRNSGPGFLVVQHDFAGKQLGHTGGVVLDNKFLEFDRERQVLQHHAFGLVQDGGAGLRTFGHQNIATKGRIVGPHAVFGGHIGNQPTALVDRLSVEQHLALDDQVAIKQSAQADQHNGAVGGDIAQLVGGTGFGGHHPALAL